MDSIGLLKTPASHVVENVRLATRVCEWRERISSEGEHWLRHAALDGDAYAMETLGVRLVYGEGLTTDPEEGVLWLKRSAECGNPVAMERLAGYLFDSTPEPTSNVEAEKWLCTAVERQRIPAKISLGSRLIRGRGMIADPERGKDLLREAAHRGSQLAHIRLAVYMLSGWGLRQDRGEGLQWLRRIGATQPKHISNLGLHLYMKSLTLPRMEAGGLIEEAAVLFQEAIRQGYSTAQLNLAYLVRRGEVSDATYPSLDELLLPHLNHNNSLARVNQALRLARGIQCAVDWTAADVLIGKLQDADRLLDWWFARSEEGDAEGHLVTAWLSRHQLTVDPASLALPERVDMARAGGWGVPDWLSLRALQKQSP